MITVAEFVRQSSVWHRIAPTLEQFVRWANSNYNSFAPAVSMGHSPSRNSLIAEIAFRLAASGFSIGSIPPADLEQRAQDMIQRLPRGQAASAKLMSHEWNISYQLCGAIQKYVGTESDVQYSPGVPGCGVVASAEADILRADELIEVKAVNRPFRGSDVRQILTYAAMLYVSGTSISRVTVLNPREGDVISAPLDQVAAGSCGRSRVELMHDLAGAMADLQVSA